MIRWEYRVLKSWDTNDVEVINAKLDQMGEEGWELVGIAPNYIYHMKRPSRDRGNNDPKPLDPSGYETPGGS